MRVRRSFDISPAAILGAGVISGEFNVQVRKQSVSLKRDSRAEG